MGEAMLTFEEVVQRVLDSTSFLVEYDRLNGTSFSKPDCNVDLTAGELDEPAFALFDFIFKSIWIPMLRKEAQRRATNAACPSDGSQQRRSSSKRGA